MPAPTDEQSTSIPDEESAAVGTAQSPEQAQSLTGKDDNEPRRASISRSKRAMWTLLFTCVFAVGIIAIGVVLVQNPQPPPEPLSLCSLEFLLFLHVDTYEIFKAHIYPRVICVGANFTGPHSDVMHVWSPTYGQINAGGVRLKMCFHAR